MTFKKAFALILILALLGAGGYYLLKVEREDDDRMRDLYTEVEPLEREREALQEEKNSLDTEYAKKARDYGTVEVLFPQLNAQIMDDLWPIMRSRGVVGVVPISYVEMPGYYNKLTYDNIRTLLADGWGLCFLYDNYGDIGTWIDGLKRNLEYQKIDAPTAVYFPNNNYDPSMDEALIAAGITTVIQNASDGRSNTVTDVSAPLWQTGAMPFGYTGSATDLELLGRTDGSNLALTLELKTIWNQEKKRSAVTDDQLQSITEIFDSWKDMLYDDDPLSDMESVGPTPGIYLNTEDEEVLHELYFNSLTDEQKLLLPLFRSVNFEKARASHLEMSGSQDTLVLERQQREAQLDRQISEIDAKIQAVYDRYDVGKKKNPEQQA